MPKLYFRHGPVNCAKTMRLLTDIHSYETQKKKIILMKPSMEKRFGATSVTSRTGLTREADILIETAADVPSECKDVACVFVEEVQFLEPAVIEKLRHLANSVAVICYGLRTNHKSILFDGSKRLMELADSIEEIKTTCAFAGCNKKAIMNLKHINGKKVDGDAIDQGGEEKYLPACWFHYDTWPVK